MEDYRCALNRLYALGQGRMLPGRGRLQKLLEHAGNPHLAIPSVLVGGTNGKGSVVAGLSAVLSTELRTGAFIKPHLKSIRERWRINDTPIDTGLLVESINQACDLIDQHDLPISFFEANVLIGALSFVAADCDIAVWEVGLGGTEDACNLVDPVLSVITNVGYDHQAILGDTLPEIAHDKAGIARKGKPLILGPHRTGWSDAYAQYFPVVQERATQLGAQFVALKKPANAVQNIDPFAEAVQPDTKQVIHAVIGELHGQGVINTGLDVDKALRRYNYRGRLELSQLRGNPVILDAAHNVDSLRFLASAVHRRFGCKVPVAFGCQSSRDPAKMLAELKDIAKIIVPLEIPVLKPCSAQEIAAAASQLGIQIQASQPVQKQPLPEAYSLGHITELDPPDNSTAWIEQIENALSLATPEAPCLICGSIYYLGEILRVFED